MRRVVYGLIATLTLCIYLALDSTPDLMITLASNLKFIAPLAFTCFSGFIFYVKGTLKDLSKLEKLRSRELILISDFTKACNSNLWKTASFYALTLFYGLILSFLISSYSPFNALLVSIFITLFITEILSLLSLYTIDKDILTFQSYIAIRAKKIEEKNLALAELKKEYQYRDKDINYFRKQRGVCNEESE
ncbi:hypothetical protein [Aeromonas salmonicida]|uniref:hypothetical protein n=1 Tax=Aeromonas salmonicida TaxID=645 RepID=UPI0038D513EC